MLEFRHVAARFFNRPLLLMPESAHMISAFLQARMRHPQAGHGAPAGESDAGEARQYFPAQERADGSLEAHAPRASRFYGDYPLGDDGRPMPFRRTPDGTAILTLVGEWVNRGAWVGASSGLISYEGFKYQLGRAAADPKTTRIILDMESPGGEAIGAFEAAESVRTAAQQKEVVAVVNGMAASAAYAIASGASRIVTMPTGLVGSIGVVWLHLDFSAWLKKEGIQPTFIFAGAHKVDGNPFEPLPEAVRKDAQAEIDGLYAQFVGTVAAGRKMSADAVRATQARVFKGQDAVEVGLADEVATFEDVIARRPGSSSVRTSPTSAQAVAPHPAASTLLTSPLPQTSMSTKPALDAETRIKIILATPEADRRERFARHLAYNTTLSTEVVIGALAAAGYEREADSAPPLTGAPDPMTELAASIGRELARLGVAPRKH